MRVSLILAVLVACLAAGCMSHHVVVEPISLTVDVTLHDGPPAKTSKKTARGHAAPATRR